MQPTSQLSCWSCGTVVSAAGGRCPACGAEQPAAPPPSHQLRQRPVATTPKRSSKKLGPLVLLITGLAVIAAIAIVFSPSVEPLPRVLSASAPPTLPPPAEPEPREPNTLGVADPAHVAPLDLLGRAKTRALAWHKDAVLVSMRAEPVVKGTVDATQQGHVDFVFGLPRAQTPGGATRVGTDRLTLRVDRDGMHATPGKASSTVAAMEPNCTLEDAVQKVVASGVPEDAALALDFVASNRHNKAVWRVRSLGEDKTSRTLDGWTCAILVR